MLCAASARAEAAAQAAPLPAPPQPAALYDRAGKIVTAPRAALVVALAAAAGAAAPAGAEQSGPSELERGKVIPEVTCLKAPGQTYALYLPPAYAPERKWPIVFGFAPDANGRRPVTLLKDAAEKYGYILAGSNRARNGPSPPIREATEAMWEDANARFSLDPRRGYATGFSGGARMAMVMALERPDRFAGIIPCGAFMPGGHGYRDIIKELGRDPGKDAGKD
jgi:poly(3-hydroxybutyrate) depolymerase